MRFQCAHWQLRFADTAAHAHSSGQRSEIPPKVRLWTGILPRIWVAGHQEHLWCSPSADCNQSAERLHEVGGCEPLFSWLCVFRESTPSIGFLCFAFEIFLSAIFYFILFPPLCPVTLTSPLVFGSNPFCLSFNFIESVGGYVFYSHRHL